MSDSRPILCVVPRWAGNQDMEWYSWLCATDVVKNGFERVLRPDVEDWKEPAIASWVARLQETCAEALARTYFVGHSVGCQGIVRYLASLPTGAKVAGCLLVAGWWQLDEPWPAIRPWVVGDDLQASPGEPAANAAELMTRASAACGRMPVLISDNDQFTANWQKTRDSWQPWLGAQVQVVPGAKHFNADEVPVVRDALAALLS